MHLYVCRSFNNRRTRKDAWISYSCGNFLNRFYRKHTNLHHVAIQPYISIERSAQICVKIWGFKNIRLGRLLPKCSNNASIQQYDSGFCTNLVSFNGKLIQIQFIFAVLDKVLFTFYSVTCKFVLLKFHCVSCIPNLT